MQYRNMGASGLKVSPLCFGTMTFGEAADESTSKELYQHCRDAGINFFDCANVYAKGESERILGRLIRAHREEVVIATKAYFPVSKDVNGRGVSRFHLTKALDASLQRLQTDYIDVYYLHHFDEGTPLEESLSTLNDFVRQGKVLYLGLSNFAAWQIMKSIGITQLRNFERIACIQPMYNLVKRQCESEILPMAQSEGLGVFPYSPLGGGLLTGKYLQKETAVGRFNTSKMYQKRYEEEHHQRTLRLFLDYARENNYHPVSLAIAWAGAHPAITAPIIGARNVEQLRPALDSLQIKLSPAAREELSGYSLTPAIATDRSDELK